MAELEEISERCRVAETFPDSVRALLRAVEVCNQLLQEVSPDFHLCTKKKKNGREYLASDLEAITAAINTAACADYRTKQG